MSCCFNESVVNVVNPFCSNTDHTVCGDCFKRFFRSEFVDDLVDIPRPYCIQKWNEYFKDILLRWLNMFIIEKT